MTHRTNGLASRSAVRPIAVAIAAVLASCTAASAVEIEVTIRNLAPANGVSFAPLRVGFHGGTFDPFNNAQTAFLLGNPSIATAPIVTIAEGGSGSTWFPAFAAADPTATLGTVVPMALTPGMSGSQRFTVNPTVNPFFTFASMVVPSNDLFIGNDSPTGIRLFDAAGNLIVSQIRQTGADVWDAGSEVAIPANGAFVVGGVNGNRVDENGVVSFELSELAAFNGLATPAGYNFDSSLIARGSEIYSISFAVVPEPTTVGLAGLALAALGRRRR